MFSKGLKLNRDMLIAGFLMFAFAIGYGVYLYSLNFDAIDSGYHITAIMPPLFMLCYFLFLHKPIMEYKSPFLILFTLVAFMRYVILSVLTLNAGKFSYISQLDPKDENIRLAGILMCYELILCSVVANIASRKILKKKTPVGERLETVSDNTGIYFMFIALVIVLIVLVPSARIGLSFGIDVSSADNDDVGSFLVLGIRECFVNAKYFLLFATLILLKKLGIRDTTRGYIIVIAVCVIVIALRIGSNKKKMICDALACMVILLKLFPRQRKITVGSLGFFAFILVFFTALSRGQASGGSAAGFLTQYFELEQAEQYFGGQFHVAIALEAKQMYGDLITWKTYILHFLRPMFIIGSFVKQTGFVLLSDIFDIRMSYGIVGHRGDQILVTLGEGYMLYGKFFAPILSAATVVLGIFFDRIYRYSNKTEYVFIAAAMAFYCAQVMILGTTQIINIITYRLTIYMLIIFINSRIQFRR